jgi:two-component system, response regulator YesN
MYKVLIVDDEKIMRLAVKTIIKWEENGFQLVGEAKDGIAALLMIERYKPDIIITDLKMPNMDGITLIKRLKEQNFTGKILVLSNYGDFDLVRDAMKWGASDYLLKVTMKADELIKILKDVVQEIDSERFREEKSPKIINDDIGVLRSKILKQALVNESDIENLEKESERLGMSIGNSRNVLLYISIDHMEHAVSSGKVHDKKVCSSSIVNIIKELLNNIKGGEIIDLTYKDFAVIIPVQNDESKAADVYKLAKNISNLVNMYINLSVSIVISYEFHGLNASSFLAACKSAFNMKFYTGDSSIIHVKDTSIPNNSLASYDFTKIIPEIKLNMEIGEINGVVSLFEDLLKRASDERSNPDDLKVLVMAIINSLLSFLLSLGMEKNNCFDIKKAKLNNSETLDEYKTVLEELLLEIFNKQQELKACAYRKEVNTIINYIKKNIDSKLTLRSIAKCVNMNESYICRMFKNETGKSIFNYINESKVNKAQELLKDHCSVVKDVAIAVGIDDQLYFNRVFRKYTGVSPTQYKLKIVGKKD